MECTFIFGFGSYPLRLTYEIPSKFHPRFPPIFVPHAIVGSPQVSFLMCTLEIPQNNAVQVLCS